MMKIILNPRRETWPALCRRPALDQSGLRDIVSEIIRKVKLEGDKALFEYSRKFDGTVVNNFKIPATEISESENFIPEDLKTAISIAESNIRKFHTSQLINEQVTETMPGVTCWRRNVPIEKAGLYIPGGTAPLFSTVLMLGIPAKIAGCREIILCTPPGSKGKVNPLILYAAKIAGVTGVFRIGGAQAIAAMAYGTESVPRADKIFGPGNQYVTRAKEMVQIDGVPIDMPAGPSEVLVIADESADLSFVASDLISQAEHGIDSQVVLLSTSVKLISAIRTEIEEQMRTLPRKEIAARALENSLLLALETLEECIEFSNLYAPEHLIISVSDQMKLGEKVTNAGSVFLGKYSCESAGDYATGTNHTLPTNGNARNFSGVSTESFMKKITFQEVTAEGIKILGPVVEKMAEAEQLAGHKNAVSLRLKSLENV